MRDRAMHVALITRYPPRNALDAGRGIAAYSKGLAQALVADGIQVTVIADMKPGEECRYREDGVEVRRAWCPGFRALRQISAAVRESSADVVHLQHELFVFGPGRAAAVPVLLLRALRHSVTVTTIHGVLPAEAWKTDLVRAYARRSPVRVLRRGYALLMRQMARNSTGLIVHGPSLRRALAGYGVDAPVAVVPQGVPRVVSPLVPRAEALRALGMDERPRALFFGYLLPYKGLDTLCAAAPALEELGVEVVVAGSDSGDEKPTHRGATHDWKSIRRMGYVPEHLIPTMLAIADVLVLPHSVGLSTSGPFAIAVAYGIPVVVSDVASLADDLGFPDATFIAGDHESLARTVARVISDDDFRGRIGDRLGEIRAERGWDSVARTTASLYEHLLRSHAARVQ